MIAKLLKVLGQFHICNDSCLFQSVHALYNFEVDQSVVIYYFVKGMYGLKQTGIIANMELTKQLKIFGYHPVRHTPGLRKHNTRAKNFTIVVDDFAIKYASKQDAEHLLRALWSKYTISTDRDASLYTGITLDWNYTTGHVDLLMPKYVARTLPKFKQALQTFHHNNKPEYSPHKHVEPNYGSKVQFAELTDYATPLDSIAINSVQKIVGNCFIMGFLLTTQFW